MWKHAHWADPKSLMDPINHGWKEEDGSLASISFHGSQLPESLSDSLHKLDVSAQEEGVESEHSLTDENSDESDND